MAEDAPDRRAEGRVGGVDGGRRRRHRADHRALVADDRVGQPQVVRVDRRRARHAAGRDRDVDAARDGLADRRGRPVGDPEVVPDHGPVEVERDEPDREGRRGPVARGQPVHALGPGARAHAGDRSIRTSLGRPARSGVTVQRAFGIRSATACTVASSWSAPISRNATPPSSVTDGRRSIRRRTTSRPSGPPSSAEVGSNAISGDRRGELVGRDVREVGAHHRVRRLDVVRQEVGGDEHHPVGHAVPDRVLARQLRGPPPRRRPR